MTTPNKKTMKLPTPDEHTHLESRVGRLEGAMETLAQESRSTNQNVRELSNTLIEFKEDVLSKIGAATTPKTSLILTYVTLLVTVMGLCGTIIMILISGQRDSTETLKAQMIMVQQSEAANRFEDGKHIMWREIVNDFIKNNEIKTDKELNSLFDRVRCAYNTRIDNLENLGVELRKWRLEHTESNAKLNGDMEARLKVLEGLISKYEERQSDDLLKRFDRADNARPR